MPNDITYELTEEKNLVEAKEGITEDQLNNKFGIANDKLFPNLTYNIYLPPFLVRKDLFPNGWPEDIDINMATNNAEYDLEIINEIGIPHRNIIFNSTGNDYIINFPGINYIIYIEKYQFFDGGYYLNNLIDYNNFYIGYDYGGPFGSDIGSVNIAGGYRALCWWVRLK